jgi:phage regulator Rha-like protein
MVMVLQARIVTRSGVARTTSLAVAEDFGRSHHAVVCDILRLDCTPAFFDKHFRSVQMVVSGPLGRDTLTHYELTKEGFLLLTGAYRGRIPGLSVKLISMRSSRPVLKKRSPLPCSQVQ